jgi:hypothetical protein
MLYLRYTQTPGNMVNSGLKDLKVDSVSQLGREAEHRLT